MIKRKHTSSGPQQRSRTLGKQPMSSKSRQSPMMLPWTFVMVCFLSSVAALYGGIWIGRNMEGSNSNNNLRSSPSEISTREDLLKQITNTADQQASRIAELLKQKEDLEGQLSDAASPPQLASSNLEHVFDQKHTGKFASGMHFVDRDDFAKVFDTGVPLDDSKEGNDRVVLLYSDSEAFPATKRKTPLLSAEEATSNCLNLHLVLTHDRKQQCIAIMGQYESFHIHKYMRVDGEKGKIDPDLPLKYTDRGHQQNGRISAKIPSFEATQEHWHNLVSYLQSIDNALDELKPILKKVASHNANNAVVVMVCNFGQSELLLNFICNARAKGLESVLSNILLFATDQATHELATSLGISSVYIDSIFAAMPEKAAHQYADRTFRDMMVAKVYCIHMVSMLGYDILFQDVDVVWYQNPIPWFHNETNPSYGFDMYFQDDGNHALFYAPYSANTGFYYVRNNERTRYFFNSFLMLGDKILSSGSHQIPLIAHLSEQASLHGLRVKTWDRNRKEFPGGFTFHTRRHKDFVKDLVSGGESAIRDTYIFHMSWTSSKVNKIKFYQQMGEWYLEETCASRPSSEIKGKNCCAEAPIVTCHFRDKPSRTPCKDSPPIDKGGKSWW